MTGIKISKKDTTSENIIDHGGIFVASSSGFTRLLIQLKKSYAAVHLAFLAEGEIPRSTYPTTDPIGSCKFRPSDKIRSDSGKRI